MNIAIFTQPLGKNYGGILQAYALQTYLKQQGLSVITIDRQKPLPADMVKSKLDKKIILKTIVGKLRNIQVNQDPSFIYENLIAFKNSHLSMTPLFNDDESVVKHFKENHYDLIVIGSDQVWRPKYSPSLGLFFADFVTESNCQAKLISYAASFGVDRWEFTNEQTAYCKNLIQKFSNVTVRETSGVDLCKKHFDIRAETVVDPTLLLTKQDYESLLPEPNTSRFTGKVVNYVLDPDESKQNVANSVAYQLEKEVIYILPQDKSAIKRLYRVNPEKYVTVQAWLEAFRDSAFVVTDSFHGCVFSILFNKPFIAVGNKERGLARFETLFNMLGLQNRMILSHEELTTELVNESIDWKTVNRLVKINSAKGQSLLFKHIPKS